MEGFTLILALVDFIPVLSFGIGIVILAGVFHSPLFLAGAIGSLAAGVCKVLWKLILGTSKRDVKCLNKIFLPLQIGGWLVMLTAVIINLGRIDFRVVFSAISQMPQLVFYILWICAMGTMIWYKKRKFERYSSKANWTAELINSVGQIAFLAAIAFSAL